MDSSKINKFQESIEVFEQKREKFGLDMEKLREELDAKIAEIFEIIAETVNNDSAKTDEAIEGAIRDFKTLSNSLRELDAFLRELKSSRSRISSPVQ